MSFESNTQNLELLCIPSNSKALLKLSKKLAKSPKKDIKKAFSLLSYCLSVDISERHPNYALYFKILEEWSGKLINSSRYEDVLKLFEVAQDIYEDSPDLNYLLADTLIRLGKTREAWEYAFKALKVCWRDPKCWTLVSILTNTLVDRWHFPMINDWSRNVAYKQAIETVVQNGYSTVVDIGSGSALLSIFAQKAGASKIYACDVDEFLCELAEDVLQTNLENGSTDIQILNCHSTNLEIPSHIPSKSLVSNGKVENLIPNYLEVHMLGFESADISSITRTDDRFTCGVQVSSACNFVKTLHHLDIAVEGYQYKPLTPVIKAGKVNFAKCRWEIESSSIQSNRDFLVVGSDTRASSRKVKMAASGRLIGFIYWFELIGIPDSESTPRPDCNIKPSDCSSPWSSVPEDITFNSLARDSPINQSILMLEEPLDVATDQEINFQFCASDSQFSVYVHQ